MASRSPSLTAASMMAAQLLTMRNKKDTQGFPNTLHQNQAPAPEKKPLSTPVATSQGRGGRRRHHHHNSRGHTKGIISSQTVVDEEAMRVVQSSGNNNTAREYTVMEPFEGQALAMDPPGTQVPNERAVLDQYESMMEAYARAHTKWRVAMKKHKRSVDDILFQEEKAARAAEMAANPPPPSSKGSSDVPIGTVEVDAADLFDLMGDDDDGGPTQVSIGNSSTQAVDTESPDVDAQPEEEASTPPRTPLPTPPVEPLPPTIPSSVTYNCRGCGSTLFVGTLSVSNKPANGAPFVTIKESNTISPADAATLSSSTSSHKSVEDGLLETMTKMKVPYPQFRCSVGGDKAVYIGARSVEVEYATADDLAKEGEDGGAEGGDETLPLHTLERFDISKRTKNAEESMERWAKRIKVMPFMPLAELKREYNTATLTHAEELRNKRLFKAAARQDRFLSSVGRAQRYPGMCSCCNRVVCVVGSSSKGGLIVNPTSVECRPSPTQH